MYDSKIDAIDRLRSRFERDAAARPAQFQTSAKEYVEALSDFVDVFNHGPGADARLMGLDTTGTLDRVEEYAAWAEEERRRVRKLMAKEL